jgi:hypothetical protein
MTPHLTQDRIDTPIDDPMTIALTHAVTPPCAPLINSYFGPPGDIHRRLPLIIIIIRRGATIR